MEAITELRETIYKKFMGKAVDIAKHVRQKFPNRHYPEPAKKYVWEMLLFRDVDYLDNSKLEEIMLKTIERALSDFYRQHKEYDKKMLRCLLAGNDKITCRKRIPVPKLNFNPAILKG
jgi:hypothetical protein